jgi:hypothetical protein
VRFAAGIVSLIVALATVRASGAEWQPEGLLPTSAVLRDILAVQARASGSADPRFAQRRERWTYVHETRRIAVTVAVRGDDFRTSLELDGLTYTGGRTAGARWRGDGNGIVHGIQADLQGDPLDRPPQAIFTLDPAACSLAGEARLPAPAWVIETHPDGGKPAFLYIDEASGTIVREVMHDGKQTLTTNFDDFEPLDGALRARHWRVEDGNADEMLDVRVDGIEPGAVSAADVAFPARRLFAPVAPLASSANFDASFRGGRIELRVSVDGTPDWFTLDTGTTSITVDPKIARRFGGATLQHVVLPRVAVGPLQLDRVSALTVPFYGNGILGLDFFFGHVIEIDYRDNLVRVLSADDAATVFADPKTAIVPINVDQGMPLVQAGFGAAQSDAFALDTGSPHLYVMDPFVTRFAREIADHWTPVGHSYVERYLEGGIEVQPFRVASFDFANLHVRDLLVGGQVPTKRTDDLAVPFDGIIGTDILQNFDLYFDYDNARLALRH